MLKLIDAHTHIQFPEFEKDRDEVIKRAQDAGVWIVNAGSDKESSKNAVELAQKYNEGVYAVVGQHPSEAGGFDFGFFRDLAQNPKVVGIGECGLDYYKSDKRHVTRDKQEIIFVKHMELANEVKKPLVIHCREAFHDLIQILNPQSSILNPIPGILHFFTGTTTDAKQLLDMGFYFSFGGAITFPQTQKIRMGAFELPEPQAEARHSGAFDEVIKFIPLDRILLETDAPYVSPESYRGNRNEPAYIIEIAKKMAELKDVSFEEICKQTTENTKKVFGI